MTFLYIKSKVQQAVSYYHDELKKSQLAKGYLKSRGVSKESIMRYQLGYAPLNPTIGWRFRNRLIFPIYNQYGTPVGWTARTLDNVGAKYINVKESAEFKKGRLLYLYHLAKKAIFKKEVAILVEGQMDAIILQQFGFLNTIAASGTAFKPAAARLLARYVKKVYVVFDADDAGRKAQLKAQKFLEDADPQLKVILVCLPEGDPASFLLKYGRETFIQTLRSANV